MLRLAATGCIAEAVLNGIPLGRTPPGGGVLCLPVNEYTLSGDNRIELVIEPPPLVAGFERLPPRAVLGDGSSAASLRLLLPRVGHVASESQARTLAQLDWVSPSTEIVEMPINLTQTVHLPVAFPRWRWVDAPAIENPESMRSQIATFLQGIALSLARGNAEGLIVAAKLRFEELAQAYQRLLADDMARLRAHVQQAHGKEPLRPTLPTAQGLVLRHCANGRLIECLDAAGRPALRADGGSGREISWPVRLAMVEGRLYVLR